MVVDIRILVKLIVTDVDHWMAMSPEGQVQRRVGPPDRPDEVLVERMADVLSEGADEVLNEATAEESD